MYAEVVVPGHVLQNIQPGADVLRSARLYLGPDGSAAVWMFNLSKTYESANALANSGG